MSMAGMFQFMFEALLQNLSTLFLYEQNIGFIFLAQNEASQEMLVMVEIKEQQI